MTTKTNPEETNMTFNVGDKVQTTVGTVTKVDSVGDVLVEWPEPSGMRCWFYPQKLTLVVAAPPKPLDWPIGTVVKHHMGAVYVRTPEGWVSSSYVGTGGTVFLHDEVSILTTIRDKQKFEDNYKLIYSPEAS